MRLDFGFAALLIGLFACATAVAQPLPAADWPNQFDWKVSGRHLPGISAWTRNCEDKEVSIPDKGAQIDYQTEVLKEDNDTDWTVTQISPQDVKWRACANDCHFSCDEIKLHIRWRVVASASAGLLSGSQQKVHGYYTEYHFNSGPGNQNAQMSIWWNTPPEKGICRAHSSAEECAVAFAFLARLDGLQAYTDGDTVRVFTPTPSSSPGWSISGRIVDCPLTMQSEIKKRGYIDCRLKHGQM